MKVDVTALDDAREAWRAGHGAEVGAAQLSSMTLGASLEAAVWAASTNGEEVRILAKRWAESVPALERALVALLTTERLPRPGDHDAPSFELRRCPSRAELADPDIGVEWFHFLDRFRRSLVKNLKTSIGQARGLSAALHEMTDNVVEHAALGDAPTGMVAYEVSEQHFGFAVADLGRGIMASLNENTTRAPFASDGAALLAAVTQGASRRSGPNGKGFADLLRALADMAGILSFRSGSSRLRIDGRGAGNRRITPSNSPEMPGFQLAVSAEPRKSSW